MASGNVYLRMVLSDIAFWKYSLAHTVRSSTELIRFIRIYGRVGILVLICWSEYGSYSLITKLRGLIPLAFPV